MEEFTEDEVKQALAELVGIMKITNELRLLCQEQIDLGGDEPQIALKQPGKWGKTNYRVLFGVKGEIVQDNFGEGLIVIYPAKELLSAILRLKDSDNICRPTLGIESRVA